MNDCEAVIHSSKFPQLKSVSVQSCKREEVLTDESVFSAKHLLLIHTRECSQLQRWMRKRTECAMHLDTIAFPTSCAPCQYDIVEHVSSVIARITRPVTLFPSRLLQVLNGARYTLCPTRRWLWTVYCCGCIAPCIQDVPYSARSPVFEPSHRGIHQGFVVDEIIEAVYRKSRCG